MKSSFWNLFAAASLGAASAATSGEVLATGSSPVAFIPDSLVVPEFIPPVRVAPKQIPAIRIDAATTVPAATGKTLTILRGEASTLPDLPPKPEPTPVIRRPRTADDDLREPTDGTIH